MTGKLSGEREELALRRVCASLRGKTRKDDLIRAVQSAFAQQIVIAYTRLIATFGPKGVYLEVWDKDFGNHYVKRYSGKRFLEAARDAEIGHQINLFDDKPLCEGWDGA